MRAGAYASYSVPLVGGLAPSADTTSTGELSRCMPDWILASMIRPQ